MKEIRIVSATGVLGSGFREESLKRAMTREPHFIGADSGSTDPGPYYLGSGEALFADSAFKRDLRLMILAGRAAKIPVIVGSACTGGADVQHSPTFRSSARSFACSVGVTRWMIQMRS